MLLTTITLVDGASFEQPLKLTHDSMSAEFKAGSNLSYSHEKTLQSNCCKRDEDKVSVPVSRPAKAHISEKRPIPGGRNKDKTFWEQPCKNPSRICSDYTEFQSAPREIKQNKWSIVIKEQISPWWRNEREFGLVCFSLAPSIKSTHCAMKFGLIVKFWLN